MTGKLISVCNSGRWPHTALANEAWESGPTERSAAKPNRQSVFAQPTMLGLLLPLLFLLLLVLETERG